jgi:glycine/D-amino acid oxidase-like deaminating enzyme
MLKDSTWELKNKKSYPKLNKNIEVDVVVIGAGITGIFSAYIMACAGLKVVVLEKEEKILQGVTMYTTAFITKMIDTSLSELSSIFGEEKAKAIFQSGQEAIHFIADIVKKESIDCEFEMVPIFTYVNSEKQFKKLNKEHEVIKKFGLDADLQINGKKLGFENSGFMEIPAQAKFHPLKFAQALADKIESKGGKIFTDSAVTSIEGMIVKTKDFEIRAKDILIATYSPLINTGTHFKKAMYVSYVFELEITKNIIPEGLYVDMDNPYHYFRIDSSETFDRMIIGGEDHRKDIKINPQRNFNALLEYVKKILGKNSYKIINQWDALVLESVDGLPLIGEISAHTFVATAFSGNGMTYSAISALIIRDLILNKKNPYFNLYNSKRTPTLKQIFVKGSYYLQELLGGVLKNSFLSNIK